MVKKDKFKNLSILYLCPRDIFLTRMDRNRFHSVRAIGKLAKVIWSGPGWENYDDSKTLKENVLIIYRDQKKPDFIFCYKPFTVKGFSEINIPTCVSYNEMGTVSHPREYTVKEIIENRVDLVIAHHKNEMEYPEFKGLPCKMINISHCADADIFKDYHLAKDIDVLLIGMIYPERYPLRSKFLNLIKLLRQDEKFFDYNMGILAHPGVKIGDADSNETQIKFAKSLNQAKICLTCSGKYRSRYSKYAEIPACRSLIMGDLPGEDHEFFKKFIVVINPEESNDSIAKKIQYYLQNDKKRQKLTDIGYRLTHDNYTQDHYAAHFLTEIVKYIQTRA